MSIITKENLNGNPRTVLVGDSLYILLYWLLTTQGNALHTIFHSDEGPRNWDTREYWNWLMPRTSDFFPVQSYTTEIWTFCSAWKISKRLEFLLWIHTIRNGYFGGFLSKMYLRQISILGTVNPWARQSSVPRKCCLAQNYTP